MTERKKRTSSNKTKSSRSGSPKGKRRPQKKGNALSSALIFLCVLFIGCIATYRMMREDGYFDELTQTGTTDEARQDSEGRSSSSIEIPLCRATLSGKNGDDHEVHTYLGFTLCYRESYEVSEWVAYTITRDELKKVTGRTDDFRPDTLISTGSAELSDYRRSGYDRGHLAPAADMEWNEKATSESFLMSNMTPQTAELNRGLWKDLESAIRDWAERFGEVTVITGPVLEKPASEYRTIGKNNVCVPEYFYKALLAETSSGGKKTHIALGFIMPNEGCRGSIWDYAASIDEIEKRTGLDFFSLIPDSVENRIEKTADTSAWK